ncbi:MAG: hypothetical protein ABI068_03730 [Ktedonobacterales bacterium]
MNLLQSALHSAQRRARNLPQRTAILSATGALALGLLLSLGAATFVSAAPKTVSTANTGTCAGNLQCVIQFGDARIQDRLTALNALSGKSNTQFQAGHITSDQNNQIQGDVTTNQDDLNTLKTKLDAETDITVARADVHNIYYQYRIFAIVLPRDYRELANDVMAHAKDRLKDGESTIQNAINGAPTSEQAQLNQLFGDYKTQVANAESQLDAAQELFPQLTPQNFDSNPASVETALSNIRNDQRTAHGDLKLAVSDLHQIRKLLDSGKGTPVPGSTPSGS